MGKTLNLSVLTFTLLLQGCAFQSALLDVEPPRAGFLITRPPVQIAYRGDVSPEAEAFTMRILRQMQTEPSTEYKFNENTKVTLSSIDGKSDKVNLNLNESHTTNKSTDEGNEDVTE